MAKTGLQLDVAPDRPLDWHPVWHRDVTLVPWGANEPSGYKRAAGCFDAKGQHIADSHCWRYAHEPATVIPDAVPPAEEVLAGRWMFGGMFYAHFGHFLVETLSRLWAIEALDSPPDGLVFYHKRRFTHELRPLRGHRPIFARLGLKSLPIRIPNIPMRLEQITFPPPAFGIGAMIAGRPEFRDFTRRRLTGGVAAEGADDIYVSRSGLMSKRGRVVCEGHLEALLEAAGYRIFHPEAHDIDTQIAQYRAARRIVALDGSALHLAAMVAEPDTKVAILNRGPSANIDDYILQFQTFAGITPVRVDAIKGCWHPANARFVKREVQSHLDFAALGAALAEAGFIKSEAGWADPPAAALDAEIAALSQSLDAPLAYRDLN